MKLRFYPLYLDIGNGETLYDTVARAPSSADARCKTNPALHSFDPRDLPARGMLPYLRKISV